MARELTDEEITLCAGIFPAARWAGGQLTEQGSAYRVAISAPPASDSVSEPKQSRVVIRFGRELATAAALERMSRLHPLLKDGFAGSWLQVPVPLGPVRATSLGPAMALSFLDGQPHPPARGNPGEFARGGRDLQVLTAALTDLLATLQQVPVDEIGSELAPNFSYRGPWTSTKAATVLGFVAEHAAELIAPTSQLLRTVMNHPESFEARPGLVHGDLAGQNMLWNDDFSVVTGVLDWDLASWWDPAINLMHLSLWHGEHIIEPVTLGLQARGLLDEAGVDSPAIYQARARFWSGVWAAENLWHAAERQQQAAQGVEGTKAIKPGALRRLFRKLGPRLLSGADAVEQLGEAGFLH